MLYVSGRVFPSFSFSQHHIEEITNTINGFQCRALLLVKDYKSADEAKFPVPGFCGSISNFNFCVRMELTVISVSVHLHV